MAKTDKSTFWRKVLERDQYCHYVLPSPPIRSHCIRDLLRPRIKGTTSIFPMNISITIIIYELINNARKQLSRKVEATK